MTKVCYTLGDARRYVAGNIWCAQKHNSGEFPCLSCRGSGIVNRNACPDCNLSGFSDPRIFGIWMKLWITLNLEGKWIDDTLFHR